MLYICTYTERDTQRRERSRQTMKLENGIARERDDYTNNNSKSTQQINEKNGHGHDGKRDVENERVR